MAEAPKYNRPLWKMVLYDLNGFPLGRIYDATERKLHLKINGIDQLDFSLPLVHPVANLIKPLETVIKVWRSISTPMDPYYYSPEDPIFCGIIGPADEQGETNQFPVTAYSPLWRLMFRYVREILAYGNPPPLVGAPMDQGEIAWALIEYTNGFDETGIIRGDIQPTINHRQMYEARTEIWKSVKDLTDFSTGFDIYPRYLHLGDGDPTLMQFSTKDARGIALPKVQFHWRYGRNNLRDISRKFDVDGFCTRVEVVGQGDGLTVAVAVEDIDLISRFGLYERVEKLDNILDPGSLTDHGNAILDQFSSPQQTITPSMIPRVGPHFGRDYDLGDIVVMRAQRGRMDFGVMKRVYEAILSLDDQNMETVELVTARDSSNQVADNNEDFHDINYAQSETIEDSAFTVVVPGLTTEYDEESIEESITGGNLDIDTRFEET